MRTVAILGCTGSVGRQTVNVIQRSPGKHDVQLLAAGSNWQLMEEQVRLLSPRWAILADKKAAEQLAQRVADLPVQVAWGDMLLEHLVEQRFDLVVAAMVGHVGLLPVITALEAGSDIALANKEVLVMAGHLITDLCKRHNCQLLPLDSEHSAIYQCLEGRNPEDVKGVILTASGGPFRGMTKEELENVTPQQAVKHPNWQMGAKISVDSATLMNKGLEVIEARWLFDLQPQQISVLLHPQSIIHSMVEFIDGSVLAQMGVPSMELPIQYALSQPSRWPGADEHFVDWTNVGQLTFSQPDSVSFPCLELAQQALVRGGNAPAIISTANDICVESFLAGQLKFNRIPSVIQKVSETMDWQADPDLPSLVSTIQEVIHQARKIIKSLE